MHGLDGACAAMVALLREVGRGCLAVGCQSMPRNGQRTRPRAGAKAHAPQRPVAVFALDFAAGQSTGEHSHPFGQLVHAASGVMRVHTRDGTWVVPPQRAVWVPPGLPHTVAMVTAVAMRTVYVVPGVWPQAPASACVVEVAPLLRELILGALAMPRPYPLGGKEERLIGVLVDQVAFRAVVPLHLPNVRSERLRRIAAALTAAPHDRRPLGQWAKGSGASSRTLARAFVRETGLSFGAWRAQLRLLCALEWLAAGRSVTDVALTLGYDSVSAFITKFKRHLGTTPARYFGLRPDSTGSTPAPSGTSA